MAGDKRKPDFTVTAEDPRTVGGKPENIRYVNVGAAWKNVSNGKEMINVSVSSLPVGGQFTGRLTLWPRTEKASDEIPF